VQRRAVVRSLSRFAALLLGLVGPGVSFAQEHAAPIVSNDRPMRFVLDDGRVVIGTKIGESPETISVLTATGVVSLRLAEITSADFGAAGRCTSGTECSLRLGAAWACMSGTCRWLPPSPLALQVGDGEEFDEDRSMQPLYAPGAPRRHQRGLAIAGGITLGVGAGIGLLGLYTYQTADGLFSELDRALGTGLMILGAGAMLVGLLIFAVRAGD
jgi:hypothetical protein